MDPQTRYAVDDGEGLDAAPVLGLGLVQVPQFLAVDHVDAGRLEELLARFRPKPLPISLLYAANRHLPKRLLLLRDALLDLKRAKHKKRA